MKIQLNPSTLLMLSAFLIMSEAAPLKDNTRKSKSLSYFDYIQADDETELQNYIDESEDYSNSGYDDNELSRMIPTKRKITNTNKLPSTFNSPIYYIRLPPQPYIFVPGLGYVSQHPQNDPGSLLNVPVNFISNGKPGTIYQWNGAFNGFPTPIQPAQKPQTPKPKPKPKPTDSPIHRLTGKYTFNGKPNDIYVLGDSYNSLYSEELQHFYP